MANLGYGRYPMDEDDWSFQMTEIPIIYIGSVSERTYKLCIQMAW